jgi:hypothetical protein
MPGRGGGSLPRFAYEQDVEAKIERQVSELSSAGVRATLEMSKSNVGGAAHVIADVATREHADLIVVGTRGHTALGDSCWEASPRACCTSRPAPCWRCRHRTAQPADRSWDGVHVGHSRVL